MGCSYGEGPEVWVHVPLTEMVLKRPILFTANGTYMEVIAYFEGYLAVAGYHLTDNRTYAVREKPVDRDADEVAKLKKWLSERLGSNSFRVFNDLRSKVGSDEEALEELRRLFQEFCAESAKR